MKTTRLGLAVAATIVLSAQAATVVLDDFSTNDESKYNFVPISNSPTDGWAVSAGQLRPSIAVNATAAWVWKQGQKLAAVGDFVTITLYPDWNHTEQSTGVGLFFGPSANSAAGSH